jgi:hypothetical protein
MMLIPLGGMVDGRTLSLGALAGDATWLMGILVFGLLVVTALVILLGGERRSFITDTTATDGYLAFLVERDGEPDLLRHTLSRREAFLDRLAREPVRSRLRFDRDTFACNLARRRPERRLDERMLWLLATARANQAERFGVGLGELYGPVDPSDALTVRIGLQEHYHTRLLADVVGLFGLPVRMHPPATLARAVIWLLVSTPERWSRPLTGAAEMAGCIIFRLLRDRGVALFAGEPDVADRIRLLYDEILADEIGHVGHIASMLGPAGRSMMRRLFRLLGVRLARQLPELVALYDRETLARAFAAEFCLDALVAELPGRAYAAATI